MKTLLLVITLFAFLQSAFLGLNIVLIILVARALIVSDRENIYLAFFGGLILSFLTQVNLGYYGLVFLLIVKIGELIKTLPVSFNPLLIFIAGLVLVFLSMGLDSIFINHDFNIYILILESVLVLPAYFLIGVWEEGFRPKRHMKLKV